MSRWWPRSLAGQAIALQILVIAVVVLVGSALALFDARNDGDAAARQQVLGIATALADSPSTAAAIQSGRATETLQPVTEAVRKNTDIAFITIMAPDRTRFTHTDPTQIGGKYIGTIEPALRGETFTEVYTGTLGPSIRAVAPVRDGTGRIVGLVSAGILQQSLADRWRSQVPTIVAVSLGALAIALVGVWAIRRRLLRQTHGLRPDELRVMYEHHDAILHSVSEGLIVLDRNGVALANDEARRLLALPPGPVDRSDLPEFLRTYNPGARDEVHVTEDRVLVVNRSPVRQRARATSEVVTIRDRTELQGALGELSSLKVLTDTLRSQAHEAANKLHTIVTMVEMGRADEAVKFATNELELSQQLVDRLSSAVGEPALVALLLGKTAQADERGIELTVTEETHLPSNADDLALSGQEMVTVLGNLIDNAMDACDREDPWVEVTVSQDDGTLLIRVADSGPGMDAGTFEKAMQRGYSTKSGSDAEQHGLGLGAGRPGGEAPQRHADRRRDIRVGGDGDGEIVISVLIVEDEPLIAEAHRTYLGRLQGFSVAAVAHTARDAMRAASEAAASETPIDLVLLDIGLPDASGIALASGLSGLRPAPDIIAITSERDLEMVRAAVGHGALAYLLKPFTFAAFRDRLERYQRYREALPAGTDAASQAEVDRALAELRVGADRSAAPKGAAPGTNDEIARAVRDSADGITADEVAKQVGVSRVTAWRYLERLADEGTLTRQTDYGKAGRPKTRYTWR